MAISSQISQVSYTGNGSLSTPYPVTFRYDDSAWVTVEEIDADGVETLLALGVDYTLTGNGATTTGNVVTSGGAIPNTSTLRITRNTALTNGLSLTATGEIPSPSLEAALDKVAMAQVDLARRMGQAEGDIEDLDQMDIATSVAAAAASAAAAAASETAAEAAETAAEAAQAVIEEVRDAAVRYRRYMPTPIPPLQALMRQMDRGMDCAYGGLGDSTMIGSGASNSWIRNLAIYLGTEYPDFRVEYRLLDYANSELDLTVLQAGPDGRRRMYAPSGVAFAMFMPNTEERETPAGAEVLYFEAEISIPAAKLTSGQPNEAIQLTGFGSGSTRAHMTLATTGQFTIQWIDSGLTYRGASYSSVGPAWTADVPRRLRATLICDDGTGTKYNVIYEYSNDSGATWTQLGSTVNEAATTTGATSIGVPSGSWNYWLGHWGAPPVEGVSWYYAVTGIGTATAGALDAHSRRPVIPERIDYFRTGGGTSGLMQLLGSPTLYVDTVASSGWSLNNDLAAGGYLEVRKWTLLRDRGQMFKFIATSYNDGLNSVNSWKNKMDQLKTFVASTQGAATNWIHVCQFPVPEPNGNYYPYYHNSRGGEIIDYAASKAGSYSIDMQQWAYDYDGPLSDLLVGGTDVHPSTPLGYAYWSEGIQFCAQEGRPIAL